MKIAVVSDIHGNLIALEAVAADLQVRGVTQVVCLGDNLSGPLLPLETARFLITSGWTCLAGNHERQILEHLSTGRGGLSDSYAASTLTDTEVEWIRHLSPVVKFSSELLLCHGTPRSDCEPFLETVDAGRMRLATQDEVMQRAAGATSEVIVCGHTHLPRIVRSRSGQLLVNPGSVGLPAYEDDLPMPHVVETGSPEARYAILEHTAIGWTAQLIALPYDHRSMAELAGKRGRHEWERALMTGYVT